MVLTGSGDPNGGELHKKTIIGRTNSGIFAEAIKMLNSQQTFGFIGGSEGYRFKLIKDVYNLYSSNKTAIWDAFIKSWPDFDSYRKYGEDVEDVEIMVVCKVVEKYTSRIPSLIEQILNKEVDVSKCDVTFTTGHKCKGLEFDNVELLDDFADLVVRSEETGLMELQTAGKIAPDEINLAYVALTRARKKLVLNNKIADFLNFIKRANEQLENDNQ
jgi:F-box protein 18 (helicase)